MPRVAELTYRSFTLKDGELVAASTYCDEQALDRASAARDWPVTRPIYYFNGTRDPATPHWQAQVHFDAQRTAPRTLVSVIDGGHNPISLNLGDCSKPLWVRDRERARLPGGRRPLRLAHREQDRGAGPVSGFGR